LRKHGHLRRVGHGRGALAGGRVGGLLAALFLFFFYDVHV
jgi:hypothetical protein